jgi:hypothetical protein
VNAAPFFTSHDTGVLTTTRGCTRLSSTTDSAGRMQMPEQHP